MNRLKNNKLAYIILIVIIVLLLTVGITYALWIVTKTQTGENQISSACLELELNNEANDIALSNQFPISDEAGMESTPYTFTITNKCNTSLDYQVALESLGDATNALKASSLKIGLNDDVFLLSNKAIVDTTVEGAYASNRLTYGTLAPKNNEGSSVTYELRIWIDYDAPNSEQNKTFDSKISVTVGQGIVAGEELSSLILADAQTNNYLYSTTPDFSIVTADGEYGLYSAQDDYGTSYYFRGDVENNYVKLGVWKNENVKYFSDGPTPTYYDSLEECKAGKNHTTYGSVCIKDGGTEGELMYWRIVRINGDGTIRLIYDGTKPIANGIIDSAMIGGVTPYNAKNDDKYVGYTYDDGNGNQVDSTIKGIVDEWYTNNLEQDYGKYIADAIYCNDREITSTSGNYKYFAPCDRLYTNKSPKLTCTNQSDRYTVEDTANGNGLLSKPIGLITADEVAMAGSVFGKGSGRTYMATSYIYWTSTPFSFSGSTAQIFINFAGSLDATLIGRNDIDPYRHGMRPVINIKSSTLFTGSGTIDDPYVLVTE